jgi:hypothetical protein
MKPNRKSTKLKSSFKPKSNKDLKQRVRHYIQLENANRKWEDVNMTQNLITTATASRLITIAENINEIINKQEKLLKQFNNYMRNKMLCPEILIKEKN